MIAATHAQERQIQILDATIRLRTLRETERRLAIIAADPGLATPDDFDTMLDSPSRMLEPWFRKCPEIAARFREYQESPEQIVSSLFRFYRLGWPYIGLPDTFSWNWHHLLLAGCLEDLASSKIMRLLVNLPPGTTKTLLCGVFFPAWRWALSPGESFMYTSYSEKIPKATTALLQNLIRSSWYQRRWGHKFKITKLTDIEIRNSAGGFRIGSGVGGGATGDHPDYVFGDDLQKGIAIHSPAQMKVAPRWYSGTAAGRGGIKRSRHCVLQQRLSINDFSGLILGECTADDEREEELVSEWHHLCLPMRFRKNSPYRYPLDPRTEEGELLWPDKFNAQDVARLVYGMSLSGEPNVDAQLDQHPKLDTSMLFEGVEAAKLQFADLPELVQHGRAVRAWDRAGTEDGGDYTVGLLMVEYLGKYYVLDVFRAQIGWLSRDNCIVKYAIHDRQNFPNYRCVNEIMPGPDGKQVHSELATRLTKEGVTPMGQSPIHDKATRARPVAAAMKYGLCRYLDKKPWTFAFSQEVAMFPGGAKDDQVDALAHAYNALRDWELGKV